MKITCLVSAVRVFFEHMILLRKSAGTDLKEIQFKKYKGLVSHAWDTIPAYRRLWEDNGFEPSMFNSLDDVRRIPCIDKNFIREYMEDMVSTGYDRSRLSLVTTGGTTGMPMKFYIDQYVARPKELAYQLWGGYHYWRHRQGLDRVVTLRGYRVKESLIRKKIFWQRNLRENGIYMSSFHILEENYDIYIRKLRSYRPRYIKAYPSAIVALCHLMQHNHDKGLEGLEGVICSSETISDWHRKLVKEVLGVEILSFYGHSEKAVCAYQNSKGEMEFQPLYGHVEFLDDDDRSVSEKGKAASVVVTGFDNHYFPFIRYRTDDEVLVSSADIPMIASKIVGRKQQFVYDEYGNKVQFTNNDDIFHDISGILAYQFVQNKPGELIINLQVDSDYRSDVENEILYQASKIFVNFSICIKIVESIEKTQSGKFRYLVQNVEAK